MIFRLKQTNLMINLSSQTITLNLLRGKQIVGAETILYHEMPEDVIRDKVKDFLINTKPKEKILVLDRAEVLQKELSFQDTSRAGLEKVLKEAVPYALDEMAYGLHLDKETENKKGLLFSLPESRLEEYVRFLKQVGIDVTEIVTEDQALAWLCFEKCKDDVTLLVDHAGVRTLAVVVCKKNLKVSRAFQLVTDSFEDMLHELSLFLMEVNQTPKRLFLTGTWKQEEEKLIGEALQVRPRELEFENSAVLSGMKEYGRYPVLSLLPKDFKLKKWQQKRRWELKKVGVLAFVFMLLVFSGFELHLKAYQQQSRNLNQKIAKLKKEATEIRTMQADLSRIEEAQKSKKETLDLFVLLNKELPDAIVMREIRKEKEKFFFKGESPNHAYLSDAVSALEKISLLNEIKLEHTRMKKRLGEEYFEFEVVGKW